MKHLTTLIFFPAFAFAQVPSVQAQWDIVQTVQALQTESSRLLPLVDQLTPADWVSKGASPTYVEQWQMAKRELNALTGTTQALVKQPEKLTVALETYFRLQLIETQLNSLGEGVRRYQNPAVADLLQSALSENSIHRGHLQQHITDLASQKEQEFSVIDKEAQRCRGMLIRQPVAPRTQNPAPALVKRPAANQ